MKVPTLFIPIGAWLLASLPIHASAQTSPTWNRQLQAVAVLPSAAGTGRYDITVAWTFEVDAVSVPFDLSTHVTLLVNSGCVGSPLVDPITVESLTAGVCQLGPPCTGSCGTYNGGLALRCFKAPFHCDAATCVCKCGAWRSAVFPAVVLTPGDEIVVILFPAPGAEPDDDTSDDVRRLTFEGGPIGWNRGLEAVTTTPSPTGGTDIQVSGYVEFDGPPQSLPAFLHLDLEVELRVNGTPVATNQVEIEATRGAGETCFEVGCLNPCGTVGATLKTCAEFPNPIFGCVCGGDWLTNFNAVPLRPKDEIMVLLRPAPGAIPEVMPDDDVIGPGVLSVDGPAKLETRLGQNSPNPFSPGTRISFTIAEASRVAVEILDLSGRRIRLLANRPFEPGEWKVAWDGRGESGERLAAGTYFYRLVVNGKAMARKMILLP